MKKKIIVKLSEKERNEFTKHEATIEACISKPFEMGRALRAIKDLELFRDTHHTFTDYVESRWRLTKSGAYAKIKAADIADIVEVHNEAQAAELARLTVVIERKKTYDVQKIKTVWKKVLARKKRQPTQASIREVISELYGEAKAPWYVRRLDDLKKEVERFKDKLKEEKPNLSTEQVQTFGSIMDQMDELKAELDSLASRVDEAGQSAD